MSHTRTIANNTLFLYIRTFITMAIGIYTSRILIKTLGVDNYGVYNLVGGLVAMFASLKAGFASAIQRFLNYEKGLGINANVQIIFNLGLWVQIIIAVIFLVVVEPIGLYFLNFKLNIPDNSIGDAFFVFHVSIITAMISVIMVPFDASIIANEKIKIYASVSMISSILRLGIVLCLPLFRFSYLRSYSILLLFVSIFELSFNAYYCQRFPECKLRFIWDGKYFKQIAFYSGWSFLGNSVYSAVNEGINIMINIFAGVTFNASRAIAYQIKSAVNVLGANLTVASRPYIVQQSATNEKIYTYKQICKLSKFVFLIMFMTVCPFWVYTDYILKIWLVNPPVMSTIFVQCVLIHLVIRSLHEPIDTMFKSFGNISKYQIFDSLSLVLALPLSYITLKIGAPIYTVFLVMAIDEGFTLCVLLVVIKKQFELPISYYFKCVVFFCIKVIMIITPLILLFMKLLQPENFLEFIMFITIFCILELGATYFFILGPEERNLIRKVMHKNL